jgi:hypothetical protein
MMGSDEAAAGQQRDLAGEFEPQQAGVEGGVVHFGAGGENFKRGRRMTERGEQALGVGGELRLGGRP